MSHLVTAHQLNCWLALSSLLSVYGPEDINSSLELYPGVGQDLMIEELFEPLVHVVHETPIRTLPKADLMIFDAPQFCAAQTVEGPRRALLDAVFRSRPKAVLLTDASGPDLFAPMVVQRYERLFNAPGSVRTYPAYLRALTDRLRVIYGYQLCRGYWEPHYSAVLALVPDGLAVPATLHATPMNKSFGNLADRLAELP